MNTLYRKVLCSERLPCMYGHYDTDLGCIYFSSDGKWMCSLRIVYPSYWFEEVTIPMDEEIEMIVNGLAKGSTAPDKECPNWMKSDIRRGFIKALELLTRRK